MDRDADASCSSMSIEEECQDTTTYCSNYNNQKDVNCRFNKHNLGYTHRHRRSPSHETHHPHHNHHYNYHRRKWWNGVIFYIYMCHVLFITSTIALSDSDSSDGNSDGASSSQEEHIKYSTNIIETRFGAVRGIIMGTNPPIDAYLGIPYASPPVGSLR